MLLEELPKKEQARIIAEMREVFGEKTMEYLRKSGWLYKAYIDPDTNSPFLPLEPVYEDTVH